MVKTRREQRQDLLDSEFAEHATERKYQAHTLSTLLTRYRSLADRGVIEFCDRPAIAADFIEKVKRKQPLASLKGVNAQVRSLRKYNTATRLRDAVLRIDKMLAARSRDKFLDDFLIEFARMCEAATLLELELSDSQRTKKAASKSRADNVGRALFAAVKRLEQRSEKVSRASVLAELKRMIKQNRPEVHTIQFNGTCIVTTKGEKITLPALSARLSRIKAEQKR